jgi:hypothetical protein
MKSKTLFVSAILAMSLISCQKEVSEIRDTDNFANSGTSAVASRLSSGPWKLSAITLKYSDGTSDSDPLDICKSDDLYKYEVAGEATVTHGAIPCSIDPANGAFASWELIENGTKLKEIYLRDVLGETQGSIVIYTVDFINSNKLVIRRIIIEPGKTYTEINTYIK